MDATQDSSSPTNEASLNHQFADLDVLSDVTTNHPPPSKADSQPYDLRARQPSDRVRNSTSNIKVVVLSSLKAEGKSPFEVDVRLHQLTASGELVPSTQ